MFRVVAFVYLCCLVPSILCGSCPTAQFLGLMDSCDRTHHDLLTGEIPAITSASCTECRFCPIGTRCLPWDENEYRCVKDPVGMQRISSSAPCGTNQIVSEFNTCEYFPGGGAMPTETCQSNLDCAFGFTCSGNTCRGVGALGNCTSSFQCDTGACVSGQCQGTTRGLGDSCDSLQDAECDGDLICSQSGSANVCVILFQGDVGDPCDATRPSCTPGLFCNESTSTCASATHSIFDYNTGIPCDGPSDCEGLGAPASCLCDIGAGEERCMFDDVAIDQASLDAHELGSTCVLDAKCGKIDEFRSFVGPRDTCVAEQCAQEYTCGLVAQSLATIMSQVKSVQHFMFSSVETLALSADIASPYLADYCKDYIESQDLAGGNKMAQLRDNGHLLVEAVNGSQVESSNVLVVVSRILSMNQGSSAALDRPFDVVDVPLDGWSVSNTIIDGQNNVVGVVVLDNGVRFTITCRLTSGSDPVEFAGTSFVVPPNTAKISYLLDEWPGITSNGTYIRIVLRVNTPEPSRFTKSADGSRTMFIASSTSRRIELGLVNRAITGTGDVIGLRTALFDRDQAVRLDVSSAYDGATSLFIDPDVAVLLAGESNDGGGGDGGDGDGGNGGAGGDGDGDGQGAEVYGPVVGVLAVAAMVCAACCCVVLVCCTLLLGLVGTTYSGVLARGRLGGANIATQDMVNFAPEDGAYRSGESTSSE